MTRTQITLFEQFLLLFNAVKEAASHEPARVEAFYSEHAKLKEAVDRLSSFMSHEFQTGFFHGKKKYHQQVPKGFQKAYDDFKKNWEAVVRKMPVTDLFQALELTSDVPLPTAFEWEKSKIDPKYYTYFNPITDDGAHAFDFVILIAQSRADNVAYDENFEIEYGVEDIDIMGKIGIEAYEYLTETIGFDPKGVFNRWDKVPVIFMPAHVSNKHGLEKGSLNNLIDDAVKAYVFGAPAAAMAMCRAALEMILKQHYNLDYKYKDGKGRTREKYLGELIVLANEKYEFVQGPRIQRYSKTANRIMHNYNRDKPLSDEDEKIILEFITTLKFLIEHAPDP